MAEVYSNTPRDATEMVTEIYPGDDHPFPVPKEVMDRVRSLRDLIHPAHESHGYRTFCEGVPPYGPALLANLETSRIRLSGICAAMYEASWQADENEGVLMRALVLGLEREIIRQEALQEWGKATLQYDPFILALETQPSTDEEVPAAPSKSSEPPQSEETDEPLPYPRFLDELNEWTDKHRGLIRALQMMNGEIDHNSRHAIWSIVDTLNQQADDLEDLWTAQRKTKLSDREGHSHDQH